MQDPNKRHGAALGFLSGGRVNIAVMAEAYGTKALTIAIRYAAVRRQFGPNDKEEVPILEYQAHVSRQHLANSYSNNFTIFFCYLNHTVVGGTVL